MLVDIPDHRGGLRPQLGGEPVGVGLVEAPAVGGGDLEFVDGTFSQAGENVLPHAVVAPVHRMRQRIPAIPVAHETDAGRMGCPDGEADAGCTVVGSQMCTEVVIAGGPGTFVHRCPLEHAVVNGAVISSSSRPSEAYVPAGRWRGAGRSSDQAGYGHGGPTIPHRGREHDRDGRRGGRSTKAPPLISAVRATRHRQRRR